METQQAILPKHVECIGIGALSDVAMDDYFALAVKSQNHYWRRASRQGKDPLITTNVIASKVDYAGTIQVKMTAMPVPTARIPLDTPVFLLKRTDY